MARLPLIRHFKAISGVQGRVSGRNSGSAELLCSSGFTHQAHKNANFKVSRSSS